MILDRYFSHVSDIELCDDIHQQMPYTNKYSVQLNI